MTEKRTVILDKIHIHGFVILFFEYNQSNIKINAYPLFWKQMGVWEARPFRQTTFVFVLVDSLHTFRCITLLSILDPSSHSSSYHSLPTTLLSDIHTVLDSVRYFWLVCALSFGVDVSTTFAQRWSKLVFLFWTFVFCSYALVTYLWNPRNLMFATVFL